MRGPISARDPIPAIRRAGRPIAAVFWAAIVLAACSGNDEPPPDCPEVAVINGLESATFYNPPATESLESLDYSVSLENLRGACSYTDGALDLSVSVDIVARFGPAFSRDTLEIPYFIAVENPSGDIVFKREFGTTIDPAPGNRSAGNREFFEQQVFGATPETGPDYSILFGLQIDRNQALRNIEED